MNINNIVSQKYLETVFDNVEIESQNYLKSEQFTLFNIKNNDNKVTVGPPILLNNVAIENKNYSFELDTGSGLSIFPEEFYLQ